MRGVVPKGFLFVFLPLELGVFCRFSSTCLPNGAHGRLILERCIKCTTCAYKWRIRPIPGKKGFYHILNIDGVSN